jgi:hypothetical protein
MKILLSIALMGLAPIALAQEYPDDTGSATTGRWVVDGEDEVPLSNRAGEPGVTSTTITRNLLGSGTIAWRAENGGESPTFYRRRVPIAASTGLWWGVDGEHSERDLVITTDGDQSIATYITDDGVFHIYDDGLVATSSRLDTESGFDCGADGAAEQETSGFSESGTRTGLLELSGERLRDEGATTRSFGGSVVVDVLFVVQPQARLDYLVANPGADFNLELRHQLDLVNVALAASGVDTGMYRLVGIEDVIWDPSANTVDSLSELKNSDGVADLALTHRDALGADIVIGIVDADGTNIAGNAYTMGDTYNANAGFSVVEWQSLYLVLGHEMGHMGGAKHGYLNVTTGDNPWIPGPFAYCDPNWSGPQYAYGYGFPNRGTPSSDFPCDSQGFTTKMNSQANDAFVTGGGLYTRLNRYSNPHLDVQRVCDDQTSDSFPTGTTVPTAYGCTADVGRRLEFGLVEMADYRNQVVADHTITSPVPGSYLSSTKTFTWNATSPSPFSDYKFEIWDPSSATSTANPSVYSTSVTSLTLYGLDVSNPVAVRLGARVGTSTWTWREFRYNVELRVVSCADEDPNLVPNPAYASAQCSDITPVCQWSSSTSQLTCDLEKSSGAPSSWGRLISMGDGTDTYDLVSYGETSRGNDYCCMWSTTTRIPPQRQLEFPTAWVSDLVVQEPSLAPNVRVARSPAGRSFVPVGLARTRRGQGRLEWTTDRRDG